MSEQMSVLAVDDEPFNLDIIEAIFAEYENVTINNATDGFEALEALEKQEFDVVLLDISMPRMNGIEVLEKIRANENLKQLPVLMVTANPEKEQEALDKGASDFIAKPYDTQVLCARTLNYAKLNLFYKQVSNQKNILEEQVKERTIELQNALKISKETEREISYRLALTCEFRDLETGAHIKRVSHYSKLLAELYGLSKKECNIVFHAAPLHDVGKVGIPDNILLKPGRFEESEFEIMKMHAKLGSKMLDDAKSYPVIDAGQIIALEHHEKYDGTGYPNKLKGEDIHIYARIVAVADVFDALSSKRPYKEAMPVEKALGIMEKDAGTHFDPKLIELFLANIDQFLTIKEKYKDVEGMHSIVDLMQGMNQ